ncbi:MAG: hypothetical protein ACK5WM_20415, partial [Rhodospirillales bacterium]
PAAAIPRLGPLVTNGHRTDRGTGDLPPAPLGTGLVQPAPAAAALRDIGYAGQTVLEIIADKNVPGTTPDADIIESHAILATSGWAALKG